MSKDVIIALDFKNAADTYDFLNQFYGVKLYVKIGMELFYREGAETVRQLKKFGNNVFLDLKLHDIPNTVEKAMANIARMGVDMVNVHAAGGIEMMKAALRGLETGAAGGQRPLLIAVTQLTSTSEQVMRQELLIDKPLNDVVVQYALNAKAAGLDGVVCSPLEAQLVKQACGQDFLAVTPGIRLPSAGADDQVRITTPAQARAIGADYIVVGRPITAAADVKGTYKAIKAEFLG